MNQAASVLNSNTLATLLVMVVFFTTSCDAGNPGRTPPDAAEQFVDAPRRDMGELTDNFATYLDNEEYVIVDVDIDNDGTGDKVVSHAQNKGDRLILFKATEDAGRYRVVLSSTNLTEDGGRILGEISEAPRDGGGNEVILIETLFPKGMDVARHYISYQDGDWVLSRTVYKASDWRDNYQITYRCEVEQNIPMRELAPEHGTSRLRQLPAGHARDELCSIE